MTGKWPKQEMDHIDRNRANNVFSNLREATVNQNQANAERYGRAAPYRGVSRIGKDKWRAILKFDNKSRHLGTYDTRDKAALAYDQAAQKQFGEFAILNLPLSVHRDWILV
jgi:HNH endonuclease/AP2 domain